jgi:hypothetical protein
VALIVVLLSVGGGVAWAATHTSAKPASKPVVHTKRNATVQHHGNCPNMRSGSSTSMDV